MPVTSQDLRRLANLPPEEIRYFAELLAKQLEVEEAAKTKARARTERWRHNQRHGTHHGDRHRDGHRDVTQNGHISSTKPIVNNSKNNIYPLAKRSRAKTRLTAEWNLTTADYEYAAKKGWAEEKILAEEERFRNHWLAKGDARADWSATWRNWVLSPYNTPTNHNSAKPLTPHQQARATYDAQRDRLRAIADGRHPVPDSNSLGPSVDGLFSPTRQSSH